MMVYRDHSVPWNVNYINYSILNKLSNPFDLFCTMDKLTGSCVVVDGMCIN